MEDELKVDISGLVQGVNLRRNLARSAKLLKLKGYVKNREDGVVEVLAQGSKSVLEELLSWIQKAPFPAKVTGMSYEWRKPSKKYGSFKIAKEASFIADEARSFFNLSKELISMRNEQRLPRHVVIIPDGNRRWAKEKGLKAWEGHKVASDFGRLKSFFYECKNMGIQYLSFWALSTENLDKRDPRELSVLFKILKGLLTKGMKEIEEEQIRFRHLGRQDRLPADIIKLITEIEEKTKNNDQLNLQLCLDYGGRDDIVRAFNKMLQDGITKVDEGMISEYLDSRGVPDPDLIIRTSGEKRTSGILAFQATYAELYFTNIYFPDFGTEQFQRAILDYAGRVRRFGGTIAGNKKKKQKMEMTGKEEVLNK